MTSLPGGEYVGQEEGESAVVVQPPNVDVAAGEALDLNIINNYVINNIFKSKIIQRHLEHCDLLHRLLRQRPPVGPAVHGYAAAAGSSAAPSAAAAAVLGGRRRGGALGLALPLPRFAAAAEEEGHGGGAAATAAALSWGKNGHSRNAKKKNKKNAVTSSVGLFLLLLLQLLLSER